MPVFTAAIDPVTRIEGHLKVEVKVDTVGGVQQVVDAFSTGTLFRGIETILEQRDPRDATLITSRICGVCPTSHGLAAALGLDTAFGVDGDTPARTNARLLRNLVHGACYIESALLHFYLLSLPDFVQPLPMAPWLPGWNPGHRLDAATAAQFVAGFTAALSARRNAHEMGAIFGGKLPHSPAFVVGGFTAVPSAADIAAFGTYLDALLGFIDGRYVPDAERLAALFDEYGHLGRGYGHLLSFGVFELDNTGQPALLLRRGHLPAGAESVADVASQRVAEAVRYSWYADPEADPAPDQGLTAPQYPKVGAYSWLKAPRYDALPCEVGPLARMTIHGEYRGGISVMDRHVARARETLKIALAMRGWLAQLAAGQPAYTARPVPSTARSEGLTEAPRGALGHWLEVQAGRIARYQVITPTCWNLSPRDRAGQRGPLEQALIGTPVANLDQPIEVLRVIHSYDPCLDCATHVARLEPSRHAVALGRRPDPP
jgi:hydrogenase large subunit